MVSDYSDDDMRLSRLPNLKTYGVIKAVTSVTTPTMGNIAELAPVTS